MNQLKVLIALEEFNAAAEETPEVIASLISTWVDFRGAIADMVRTLKDWQEENGIQACWCYAERLTDRGKCPQCDKGD